MNNKLLKISSALIISLSFGSANADINGWTTVGSSGVQNYTDGVVNVPTGYNSYDYISTFGGVDGATGGLSTLGTNGSIVTSNVFAATADSSLSFMFDYITSDGKGYPDYAWAQLYTASGTLVSTLFTAQTNPNGNTVPGVDLPITITANINPAFVDIYAGSDFSPLGKFSGMCWDTGCGNTGWVKADYTITNDGNYYLQFGVANTVDTIYDSALAWSGAMINNSEVVGNDNREAIPEPSELLMLLLGSTLILNSVRNRKVDK